MFLIYVFSPLICFATDYLVKQHTGYAFGYEMLMLNGAITFFGLWAASVKHKTIKV